MNKRSLWISAVAALAVAVALAGCGTTTYFAGRALPPSGLRNRVLIAVQNPSSFSAGALGFVDAYYDIRFVYNSTNTGPAFSINSFAAKLPSTIQNMPEQQLGAVYGSGDGSFTLVNYATETAAGGTVNGLNGPSSSVFVSRSLSYVVAASQSARVLTVVNRANGSSIPLNLPGVYRVSMNPGGSVALAFVQNSNYVYYPIQLTAAQTLAYSGGASTWPTGAVDCEPFNNPIWCLFQAQDPATGLPLTFDRPVKAVFSADGGTAYILNCGPECGGTTASITPLPVAPMIFLLGQKSGALPTASTLASSTVPIPGGASNALVDSSTMYVVGQCAAAATLSAGQPQCGTQTSNSLFTGMLTVVTLPSGAATTISAVAQIPISDGAPGAVSRMIEADDNTLWIGMTKCTDGARVANGLPYGCLSMVNISNLTSPSVTLLPYIGDATGIAGVTGLHKVYTVEGGQVYIYSTVNGSAIDNQYVTVTGTAYDVAYMDGLTDGNNTVY
ncbi:MAG: hypothetical protein WAN35_15035 [Terracidiphilus sp.]